jgi:hypothetical protein
MSEQQAQWQPIETAPKDGTNVLLFGLWAGEIHGVHDCPSMEIGYFSDGSDYEGFDWVATGGDYYCTWGKPTHWMPLPDAPKDKA